jgi:hypothetical protein
VAALVHEAVDVTVSIAGIGLPGAFLWPRIPLSKVAIR